ncbi:MAG: hypothetical protein RL418_118 [Actinomycetota bacterium]
MANSSQALFAKALKLSILLVAAIVVIGSGLGWVFAGTDGFFSALLGGLIALVFTTLTILSVALGAKLPLGAFYGLVLGGWLIKIVLFAIAMGALQNADFVHGPTLFFAIVVSVLGGLGIDSWVVLRSRVSTISE